MFLSPQGSLETKEFILDEVARGLGLQRNYFCLLAALLGNYLLTEIDLKDFYASLIPGYDKQQVRWKMLIIESYQLIKYYSELKVCLIVWSLK